MRIILILFITAAFSFGVFAEESGNGKSVQKPVKSIFSLDAGYAGNGAGGHGYAVFLKTAKFLNEKPYYLGFGSLFGEFSTIGEIFFETGVLVGYSKNLGTSGWDIDVYLDFLLTGGRIEKETMIFRSEAPALHAGISLGFPTFLGMDGALWAAPVIRPYDARSGTWDFSRSYVSIGFSLRLKSFALIEQRPWSDSFTPHQAKGGKA
jgi:hypothetical protein